MAEAAAPLLELADVHKEFGVHSGVLQRTVASVKAVSGVSFAITAAQTFGLVGESGRARPRGRLIATLDRPTPAASGLTDRAERPVRAGRCAGPAATCS